MFGLAAGVSLDALGVGVSLGAFDFNIPLTVLTLGEVAALMTFGGLIIGRRLVGVIGDKAELAGGAILTVIGFKLFF
jgi:putative Mn2+ efflux pump MntP